MGDPALSAATMAEVLRSRAESAPERLAFCFLVDGEEEGPRCSYGALDRAAQAIAVALRDQAEPGERALLLYAPGLEFLAGLFGCLYAGILPVPAYPPRLDRLAQSWQAVNALAIDCGPRLVLTAGAAAPLVAGCLGQAPALAGARCLLTDDVDPAGAGRWRAPATRPDDVALLQYTSGSTAAPKGVMLTHRNLMHNQRVIRAAFEHDGPGVGVTWLPPYHDMGLIGGLLQVVYHGASMMLMSPVALVQEPVRWLRAIARYRADTSGGPNFAYDLCVQRTTPEERAALDLSRWSVAAIGSEPVNPATLQRFTAAFAPAGFRPEAFYPCYGLAEATLLVTGGAKAAAPVVRTFATDGLAEARAAEASAGRTLVGCGHAWLDQEVRIIDPDTQVPCPDGTVGEVWVAGPSVAPGYWGRPDENARVFGARLHDGRGPYLRTGDLGFFDRGELFLTGRSKDVIIIRGRNHYPEELEDTAQSVHPGLRRGGGAAFEVVHDGEPALVLVQEVERRLRGVDAGRLAGDIRQAVSERHQLRVADVRLVEPGSIPRTSSGKVQRHRCRLGYEQGTLRPWRGKPA